MMKQILFFSYLMFFILLLSCKIVKTPEILQMNNNCFIYSGNNYTCSQITGYFLYDPERKADLEFICKNSNNRNFTNNDLANLITKRLYQHGLKNCNLKSINDFGPEQIIDICHMVYKKLCYKRDIFLYKKFTI